MRKLCAGGFLQDTPAAACDKQGVTCGRKLTHSIELADDAHACPACTHLQVGVCAVYEGQQVVLSDLELQQERSELPVLPPSLFGQNATCRCCRTADQVVQQYGAVHGQRVQGELPPPAVWGPRQLMCLAVRSSLFDPARTALPLCPP